MFNKFFSVSEFYAKGDRILEFINTIRDSSIVCSWLGCKKDIYYGKIYTKHLEVLQSVAEDLNIQLVETSRKGLLYTLSKYKKRYGILIGMTFCISLWIALSNVVVTIDIEGNKNISNDLIISCLQDAGLSKGAYLPNIDLKSCEYALRLNLEDVAWASIKRDKGRILVRIDEMVNHEELLKDNKPCNIVSTVSARVVSVKVLNGQLMTPIGNGVTDGELLISGVIKNDKEMVRYVHAMGEVIGEYKESITLTQPLNDMVTSTNGEIKTYKELDLFNLKIPLYIGKKDTSSANIKSNTQYFKLFGNKIPIGTITTTCEKYSTNNVSYSVDDAKALLNSRRKTYEVNFLKDKTIVDVKENFITNDEKVSLTLEYTLQGNICETQSLFIR